MRDAEGAMVHSAEKVPSTSRRRLIELVFGLLARGDGKALGKGVTVIKRDDGEGRGPSLQAIKGDGLNLNENSLDWCCGPT